MLSLRRLFVAAGVVVAIGVSPKVEATPILDTTFALDGVTFADGGEATGKLIIEQGKATGATLLSADVTTTAGSRFGGAHYLTGSIFVFLGGSVNAWVVELDVSNQLSTFILNIPVYPNPISTTAPTGIVATTAYPGEVFRVTPSCPCDWRVLTSGRIVPLETIDVTPPPPPPTNIPEPPTLILLGAGLAGWAALRCRRQAA